MFLDYGHDYTGQHGGGIVLWSFYKSRPSMLKCFSDYKPYSSGPSWMIMIPYCSMLFITPSEREVNQLIISLNISTLMTFQCCLRDKKHWNRPAKCTHCSCAQKNIVGSKELQTHFSDHPHPKQSIWKEIIIQHFNDTHSTLHTGRNTIVISVDFAETFGYRHLRWPVYICKNLLCCCERPSAPQASVLGPIFWYV